MSQYPQQQSPYQPPSPQQYPTTFDYYQPAGQADVLGPAKRAAIMMFVVAGVTLLGAFCCAGFGAMLPQVLAQNPSAQADLQAQMPPGMSMDMLRMTMIVLAVIVLLLAVGMTVLGVFVRKGSKAAVVMSIVLVVLALLYLLINTVVSVVMQRAPAPQMAMTVCMMAVPIGMLAFLLVLLWGALRSSDQARVLREQHMQQYWQYAYAQQMYAQQQQQMQQMQQQQQGQQQQGQQSWPQPQQQWDQQQPWPPPPSPPPPSPPPPSSGGSDAGPPTAG
jgi:hypothetical protein